jgi:hypothetical protein
VRRIVKMLLLSSLLLPSADTLYTHSHSHAPFVLTAPSLTATGAQSVTDSIVSDSVVGLNNNKKQRNLAMVGSLVSITDSTFSSAELKSELFSREVTNGPCLRPVCSYSRL